MLLSDTGAIAAALIVAALIAAFPWQSAVAQAAVPCTAISDDEERLACYDRALRAASAAPAAPTTAPAAQAPTAPTPAAPTGQPPAAQAPAAQAPAAQAPVASAAEAPAAQHNGDEVISIVIVGVRALPGRETTFTAQDGVTWVQTDSQRVVGLPETPFAAELKPGAMGSQFLVPIGRARAIRVKRVEP